MAKAGFGVVFSSFESDNFEFNLGNLLCLAGDWVDEDSEARASSSKGLTRLEHEKSWMGLKSSHGLPIHVFRCEMVPCVLLRCSWGFHPSILSFQSCLRSYEQPQPCSCHRHWLFVRLFTTCLCCAAGLAAWFAKGRKSPSAADWAVSMDLDVVSLTACGLSSCPPAKCDGRGRSTQPGCMSLTSAECCR